MYNEAIHLRDVIDTLRHQIDGLFEHEIIIVNNASTDKSLDIIKSYPEINLVDLKVKIPISEARNIGFNQANFDILAFIDGDILVTRRWATELSSIIGELTTNPLQITGHKVDVSKNPSLIESAWFGSMKARSTNYINSGNLITTRSVMLETGGFNVALETGEDVDFCVRARRKGIIIKDNNYLHVHHEGYPKSVSHFVRRELWHGVGDFNSISYFLSSKVAVFSTFITVLIILLILFIFFGMLKESIIILSVIVTLNSFAAIARFRILGFRQFITVFLMHILYCVARTLSIFKVLQ